MKNLIQVLNFKKAFESKVVHSDISFTVTKGECLGLIGGSGAGKSVILRSLIGLEKADSGQIIINTKNITHFSEKQFVELRKKVAYVFQGGALFDSMSVYENLAYPLREHTKMTENEIREKILGVLEEFGLAGNETLYPSHLSGGMQKRVGLARAIIMNPEIVLYDEPTAGLDPFNTKKINEMILRLKKKGVTSILVTHDMSSALAVCDRIAMIMKGRVISQCSVAEIQKQDQGLISQFIQGEIA
jgi:phospholipid/cholesterol/gamma-HCH transport system ATP-binding protein